MGGGAIPFVKSALKIKGGKWTVAKFFTVSVAYTSAWLAVSSELGYYRELYGPQVLLYLNIAYYAPSIPLLVCSSLFDAALEASLGIARTIFLRLVVGLVGYLALCIWFPFAPEGIGLLLGAVVALGLFSSVAFSASYQLVSRFANKNLIALGLGCIAGGPLLLALELVLGIGNDPTRRQQVALFGTCAAVVIAGLWATVSLLFRHWDAIEASAGAGAAEGDGAAEMAAPLLEAGAAVIGRTPSGGSPRASPLFRTPSLPPLLAYNLLEPYETYLHDEEEESWHTPRTTRRWATSPSPDRRHSGISGSEDGAGSSGALPRTASAPGGGGGGGGLSDRWEDALSLHGSEDGSGDGEEEESEGGGLVEAVGAAWPALLAIGAQGGIALTLFPFFTYIPSSGTFGDELPKVLFFVRIFADIAGRVLPRAAAFRPTSVWPVLAVALAKLATEPLFFLYLKSPPAWHSDAAAVVYVGAMWAAGGYVNTAANMVAPWMVSPRLKSSAMALMAIVYQAGHFFGLALAWLLAWQLFGAAGVET